MRCNRLLILSRTSHGGPWRVKKNVIKKCGLVRGLREEFLLGFVHQLSFHIKRDQTIMPLNII